MKTFKVAIKYIFREKVYLYEDTIRAKTYSNAVRNAVMYLERTCPYDFMETTQIAMRVKRKLT